MSYNVLQTIYEKAPVLLPAMSSTFYIPHRSIENWLNLLRVK